MSFQKNLISTDQVKRGFQNRSISKGFDLSELSGKGIQTFEEEDSRFAGEGITVFMHYHN